ncbi:unnamed protein product, partial [marine sediment metagenome]
MTLLVQLYKTFSNNKDIPRIVIFERDGRKTVINAIDSKDSKVIKNTWMNTAKVEAGTSGSLLQKSKEGKYLVDKKRFLTATAALVKMDSKADQITQAYQIVRALGLN